MNMFEMLLRAASFERRSMMRHVIINASCLLIICTAANIGTDKPSGKFQSIPDTTGAGNTPDNKQTPAVQHRYQMLGREVYVNGHDKTLSAVKSDYDVKRFQSKRDSRFSANVRWKRSPSNISTNSHFNILNLSNKSLSDGQRLTEELSKYSHRQTSYEISHYYDLSDISALDLSRNNLSDELPEPVQEKFSSLSWLDLSENNLTTAIVQNIPTLKYLNLSSNHIKSLSSTHLHRLTRLDVSCNAISSESTRSSLMLRNLTDLDLSCNQLETIDKSFFFHTRSLHRLDLSENAITRLNRSIFYNLINLEHLNLAGNRIDVIENDTFAYLPNLQFLDLSRNDIGPGSIRALQGIPALIGLSLAQNVHLGPVMHEFVASWSLKELDASGTGLCHIPTALAQSVKSLKLTDNLLSVIRSGDLDSYPLLQQLILSDNLIADIEEDALGRLELLSTLFLDRNRLVRIPISLPSNLVHLHLQNNEIYELQPGVFRNLKNLKTLNLAGNRIAYLPELPLPELAVLNVRRNDLKGLSQSVVKTSPHLRDFLLENNPVKCADLLGIAEWVKPCRDEMLFDDRDYPDSSLDDSGNEFDIFGRLTTEFRRPICCQRDGTRRTPKKMAMKTASFKSLCQNENLINLNAPNRLKGDQTTVKQPLGDGKTIPAITISSTTTTSGSASTPSTTVAAGIGMMDDKLSSAIIKESLLKNLTTSAPLSARQPTPSPTNHYNETGGTNTEAIIIVEERANLNVNFGAESSQNLTTVDKPVPLELSSTLQTKLQLNFHNETIKATKTEKVRALKKDKISSQVKKAEAKKNQSAKSSPRSNLEIRDKLENSSTVNKVVNLTAITPIVNVTGRERDEASDKSYSGAKDRRQPAAANKKVNRNSLIQADSMATETSPSPEQVTSTSDKLVEITTATMTTTTQSPRAGFSSSLLTPSLTPMMATKYERTVEQKWTTSATTEPTLVTMSTGARTTTNVASINNQNTRRQGPDSTKQTNDSASSNEGSFEQNVAPSTAIPPVAKNYLKPTDIVKVRKNVNHMKMKLKFNHDQLHDDEFRDNFDTDSVGLLMGNNFGYGHAGHGSSASGLHRKSKFSIYDSIYMASLKNANFKPFHHSMHVPNTSNSSVLPAGTTTANKTSSNAEIPATSVETSSKILPQEWNDVRPMSSGGSHYGLFIVVGATFGMLISFGLFHLYYCRVRRGQHLHGHHHHYQQYPPQHGACTDGGSGISTHNSTQHRYSYAFEQDDSDERLTYTISTSVLDGPEEDGCSTIHQQQHPQQQQRRPDRQRDVLHMDILNPLKSKPLSRNSSSSSSSSASSCFDIDSGASNCSELGVPRPSATDDYRSDNQQFHRHQRHLSRNTPNSNNHNNSEQNRPTRRDSAIDRW
ncbi:uncharacterized protein LOC134207921 [Armigeres subalbatus]|uniref:uncharacterized protein LOC134207921 n=1 Tax=Armigeres subalbatus TaxID=124917 RepID=UPI002ED1DAD8